MTVMKVSLLLLTMLLSCIGTGLGQQVVDETWGCGLRDYKCQLDTRMKALAANPKEPENYYNLGIVYMRMGQNSLAVEAFSMYLQIPGVDPKLRADGYSNRGISQRALKRPDLAIEDYSKGIELNPRDTRLYINRANANADLKKHPAAVADYDRAIEINPKYGFAYAQRGNYLSGQGRVEAGLADLAKAIELDPAYPESYYNRAVIYLERKEYPRAISDLDKYIPLIAHNPQYTVDGLMNRGIAHYYTGSKERAIADLTKAAEVMPTFPNAYRARAMVYRSMKKDDLAAADEKRAADLAKAGGGKPGQ